MRMNSLVLLSPITIINARVPSGFIDWQQV
jgi:hypothetical protein